MNDDTLNVLWIGAFRYYLGRMTASVHSFCDSMIKEYDSIPDQAKGIIKRDLIQAFADDDRKREKETDHHFYPLGHDVDRAKWLEVLGVFSGL